MSLAGINLALGRIKSGQQISAFGVAQSVQPETSRQKSRFEGFAFRGGEKLNGIFNLGDRAHVAEVTQNWARDKLRMRNFDSPTASP